MSAPAHPERPTLFDLPLDAPSLAQTLDTLGGWISQDPSKPHTVVTLNPEFVMDSRSDDDFIRVMQAADLVTADGVGIVWAAKTLQGRDVPRAPGVDIARGLMRRHGPELRVFFLGGTPGSEGEPGVAERAAQNSFHDYGIQIAGHHHGYFGPEQDAEVAAQIAQARPHLLLTGMGGGRQEKFNEAYREVMGVPVAIGCGGTLDVLAGTAELAPEWTRRAGVEFVWRIASDRSRWGRAPKLARFVPFVLAARRRHN
ncbi:WecB/TagA/CpsF family glycosyltransferase [Deinococcus radiophilus]|uniref:WecB/TagA/CpsF family glycosyltransferase n=1 Tax=Deinococcus radiophilus TaxID=32062 RepID=UPI001E425128|nr:WecB/TagA/CpsF family glycosyltransferase [Deinococcus radiophilus]UFA50376.1 WecB/TagA/CpsF family glycosyltransferase [Deinococcus radiophilus]